MNPQQFQFIEVNYQAEKPNIRWLQLLQCEDFLLLSVL